MIIINGNSMKTVLKSIIPLLYLVFLLLNSCSDTTTSAPDTTKTGTVTVEFDNVAGDVDLSLGKEYTLPTGEKITPDLLQYYISNIRLKKADGTEFIVNPDSSYFLIKESVPSTQKVQLRGVPEGDYTAITFTIGVDSARCMSPLSKRTGALDPAEGMYWTWNQGYIFIKCEGSSPASSEPDNRFRIHAGGFGSSATPQINAIRTTTLSFGDKKAMVRAAIKPEIHLIADIYKLFKSAHTISLISTPSVMFSPVANQVADNYQAMFAFDHVHND
jgi:hypothetical protein